MSIMTLYVKAESKKAINERLSKGETVTGVSYTPWGETMHTLGPNLADGTVIKVWSKMSMGSPYAKAYGQWNSKTQRVK